MIRQCRSLRGRMMGACVVLTVCGIALGVALTSALIYFFMKDQVTQQINGSLAMAVRFAKANVPAGGPLPGQCFAAVFDRDGHVIQLFGFTRGLTLPGPGEITPGGGVRLTADRGFWYAVGRLDGDRFVMIGESTGPTSRLLNAVVRWQIIAGLVVGALATLVCWRVSGWVLRPIGSLSVGAQKAATGDLSEQVTVTDAPMELRRLGNSFNIMLNRLSAAFAKRDDAERQLRHFLALTGHELRTPLTTIRGYAQLAELGGLSAPEDVSVVMERVQHEANRMTALVEELMLLTRLDEGRELERELVDLDELCAGVVADARIGAPDREFACEIDPGRHHVLGDRFRLQQVLTNLLSNVRSHTPAGTVATLRLSRDGDEVVIDVRDTGPGIPEDRRTAVFERFFQGERTGDGLGLGLSIVAAITKAHGGSVAALPSETGAWLRVRLPLAPMVTEAVTACPPGSAAG